MKKLLLLVVSFSFSAFAIGQDAAFKKYEATQKLGNDIIALHQKGGSLKALAAMMNPTAEVTLTYDTAGSKYDSISRVLFYDYDNMGFPATNIEQEYVNNAWRNTQLQNFKIQVDTTGGIIKFKIDSIKMSTWDTVNNVWILAMKVIYDNDLTNWKPLLAKTYLNTAAFKLSLGIVLYATQTFYYDVNKFQTAIGAKNLDLASLLMPPYTPKFILGDSTENVNDANGNPTSTIDWAYDKNKKVRVREIKTLQTYDANDNVTEEIEQVWDTTGSIWVNDQKSTYTYDANDNLATDMFMYWDKNTSAWVNTQKTSYTYDANDNQIERLHMVWNYTNSVFENSTKSVSTYNANDDKTLEMDYEWISNAWSKYRRTTHTYLVGGEKDYKVDEWTTDNGTTWTPANMSSPNGEEKTVWFYTPISAAVASVEMYDDAVRVFPNPSNGLVSLALGKNIAGSTISVTIMNITGQSVYKNVLSNVHGTTVSLNLSNLAAGTYLLEVSNGSNVAIQRLVITQ